MPLRDLTNISLVLLLFSISAFAQKPELFVQTGHSAKVDSLALSRDGKLLASGSFDSTIKLWDVTSGKLLRTLIGHKDGVGIVAFSPNGEMLLSKEDYSDEIKLWNVSSGEELRPIRLDGGSVFHGAFSPDRKAFASGSGDAIKIWDLASGNELFSLKEHSSSVDELDGVSAEVKNVAWSPNGKVLASIRRVTKDDGSQIIKIQLWDLSTKRIIGSMIEYKDSIDTLAWSPDDKTLAGAGKKDGNAASDNYEYGQCVIKFWDVMTGNKILTLLGQSAGVNSIAFSPLGNRFASSGAVFASSVAVPDIKLWNFPSGKELSTPKDTQTIGTDYWNRITRIAFSSDNFLLSGNENGKIGFWDVSEGKQLRVLGSYSIGSQVARVSPDGNTMATGGGSTIALWDITASTTRILSGYNPVFSADSKLLMGREGSHIKIRDVRTGAVLRTIPLPSEVFNFGAFTFSFDNRFLAGASGDQIHLWDANTGKMVKRLKEHWNSPGRGIGVIAFGSTSQILASGESSNFMNKGTRVEVIPPVASQVNPAVHRSYEIAFWNVKTRNKLGASGYKNSSAISSMAFNPDDTLLAAGCDDGSIKLLDVRTGRELHTLEAHSEGVLSVAFSGDGRTLASGGRDRLIKLWDVTTGKPSHMLMGHSWEVSSIAFIPDSQMLVSGSADSQMKLWDFVNGNELATLFAFPNGDWFVASPDGLFDGSPGGWKQVSWRLNKNTFDSVPVEAFYHEFYYPGLLAEIMSDTHSTAPQGKDISQKDRRQIPVTLRTVEKTEPRASGQSPAVTLQVEVEETPSGPDISDKKKQLPASGAQDVRLFRNGSLVKLWKGDIFALRDKDGCAVQSRTTPKSGRRAICTATVPIIAGENHFAAYAFNKDNIKSEDATLNVTGAATLKRKGTLYIVAVGVNKYKNSAFDLTYAVPDAEDFSAELKRQQDKMKNYKRTEIIPLYNDQAEKERILGTLAELVGKVLPEDGVVIFFAGHGTVGSCLSSTTQAVNAKDRFYLVPHDMAYRGKRPERCDQKMLDEVAKSSISDEELARAFEGIDAGQILLIIDACNSGQALEAEDNRRGSMNSKGLAQLAYDKGMYILTAAQNYQAARGSAKLGHGYLTFALVKEGLKTAAADTAPKDGQVLMREWLDFATTRVPQIREQALERRELVHPKRKGAKQESEELQHPRVFYRREVEPQPMVIAKPLRPRMRRLD